MVGRLPRPCAQVQYLANIRLLSAQEARHVPDVAHGQQQQVADP